jgi:hypothetical protein
MLASLPDQEKKESFAEADWTKSREGDATGVRPKLEAAALSRLHQCQERDGYEGVRACGSVPRDGTHLASAVSVKQTKRRDHE